MKQLFFTFIILLLFSGGIKGLEKESEHFIFYFEASDSSVIDTIASRLEGSYSRITGDLRLVITGKTGVHVYPTLRDFHNAIGWPDAPDWVVGLGSVELHVVSPLNPGPAHSYSTILDNVFIHEFAHVCTWKINRNLPIWLNEGFALYEGGPYYSEESVVEVYNNLGRIPGLDELNSSFDNFSSLGGYPLALTIATFIIETYGMEKMSAFIRTPSDYSIFSTSSKNEFQELWFEYVEVNYLGLSSAHFNNVNNFPEYELQQNYPNPFNPVTVISFTLPKPSYVQIIIFDALGKEIAGLINEEKPAGNYSINFAADGLSSGIYYYQIKAGDFIQTKKMTLTK
jgi:hypothetical protein